jgi:hypothetical protein
MRARAASAIDVSVSSTSGRFATAPARTSSTNDAIASSAPCIATARSTSPARSASRALHRSPSSSSRIAAPRPTRRGRSWVPPKQGTKR